jgi:hypothetical protein
MTRTHEAAGELAAGLRDVIAGDPLVEHAKGITKCVDTLQVVAAFLFQDPDKGGTGGQKSALQEHLTRLRAASVKCSTRIDFATEEDLHKEAFVLCKHLECTPKLLSDAMNLNFESLVDLNSSHAQSAAPYKKSLLSILRNLGQAYCEITVLVRTPTIALNNFPNTRKRIWKWYRRVALGSWLILLVSLIFDSAGFLRSFFLLTFASLAMLLLSAFVVSRAMPFLETAALRRNRKKLAELGIHPDRNGDYHVLANGLSLATDYGVLERMLRARGHHWENFGEQA